MAAGKAPGVALIWPSRASSPIAAKPWMASGEIASIATISASAIGKSKWLPSFGRSAGARLTVMWVHGRPRPIAWSAFRTRSRLSATALSGKPTMAKTCCPGLILTSTWTGRASIPTNANVEIRPYMLSPASPPTSCRGRLKAEDEARQEHNENRRK